jgi:DNA-binding transcriptional MerR regulator/effector-binding domain-containing protein
VGDFAKITRTTADTLYYYDKIGLLSPVSRGTNRYRYYSIEQLAVCNTIRILHKLGVPLTEIIRIKEERTPELAREILMRQIDDLQEKKENIKKSEKLLSTLMQTIASGLDVKPETVSIEYVPAAQIILGEPNDYSGGRTDYGALMDFYVAMRENPVVSDDVLQYPVWGTYSTERVKSGDLKYPDRYYFYYPDGKDQRPGSLYAVGYTRAGYGQNEELYKRMISYIAQHNFEICGDAYEEYPLNEICTPNHSNYLMRLMITVREK